MELGRALPPYPEEWKTPERLVAGCQSVLYLNASFESDTIFFHAHADALISQGLAALLIQVYSGLPPKLVVLNPPAFLHELGIFISLSPHRSNGLASIYNRMRLEAVKYITTLVHNNI